MADRDVNFTNQQKIDILKGNLTASTKHYRDLLFEKLGTNRKSEVIAKIGDKKIPYEELINNYLKTL